MTSLGKTVVCIPARAGSKRVKSKNLRDFCGKPLLSYAIENAKSVFAPSDIYVNSDSPKMLALAKSCGVNSYKRHPSLASDNATGDEFMFDFLSNVHAATCVMLNPVCPLITPEDIRSSLVAFESNDCDTLISCCTTKMQTFCEGKPVNIDMTGHLKPTQNNPAVSILNWAVTIWNVAQFCSSYSDGGSAYLGKKRFLFDIEPLHGIKISYEEDFITAEKIYASLRQSN